MEKFVKNVVPVEVVVFVKGHYCLSGSHGWYTHILPMVQRLKQASPLLGLSEDAVEKALYAVLFHDSGAVMCREKHEHVGASIWQEASHKFGQLSEKGEVWMAEIRSAIEHHRHSGGWDYSQLPLLDQLVAALDRNPPATEVAYIFGRALEFSTEMGLTGLPAAERALKHVQGKYLGQSFNNVYRKLYASELAVRDAVIRNTTVEDLLKLL